MKDPQMNEKREKKAVLKTYSGQNRIKTLWEWKKITKTTTKTLKKLNDESGRTHLHLPLSFICCSFHPFCSWLFTPNLSSSSSATSLSVPLHLPCHLCSFSSMYIFRSWVIKSAPAGMCWNRISLILPCPHYSAKKNNKITQICKNVNVCEHTSTGKMCVFFFSFSFAHKEKPDTVLYTTYSLSGDVIILIICWC